MGAKPFSVEGSDDSREWSLAHTENIYIYIIYIQGCIKISRNELYC